MTEQVLEPRVYELGYHILSTVGAADLESEVTAIKQILMDNGGLPFKEQNPALIDLAYPMSKVIDNKRVEFSSAYFGWIKFDVPPHQVKAIHDAVAAHPKVLRFLLVETVREDTYREPAENLDKPATEAKVEVAKQETKPAAEEAPVDEEELNKQIDEIVSEE